MVERPAPPVSFYNMSPNRKTEKRDMEDLEFNALVDRILHIATAYFVVYLAAMYLPENENTYNLI